MSRLNLDGYVGRHCLTSNAHYVDIGKNYNGSGDDAFGGAKEWPRVDAHVSFQVGEERRAIDFAKKLSDLIKAEFEMNPGERIQGVER